MREDAAGNPETAVYLVYTTVSSAEEGAGHSYAVPAINAIRLDAGHPEYWQWVQQVVGEFSGGGSR